MGKIFKTLLCSILLLACCLQVSAVTGVITVFIPAGSELTLYRVGSLSREEVSLEGAFATSGIRVSRVHSPEAARLLAEFAREKDLPGVTKRAEEGSVLFENLPEGVYLAVQTKPARGVLPILPFLFSLPEEDCYAIEAKPKQQTKPLETQPESDVPKTGDTVQPLLLPAAVAAVFSGAGILIGMFQRKNRRS